MCGDFLKEVTTLFLKIPVFNIGLLVLALCIYGAPFGEFRSKIVLKYCSNEISHFYRDVCSGLSSEFRSKLKLELLKSQIKKPVPHCIKAVKNGLSPFILV
jgi:hypothetical protein